MLIQLAPFQILIKFEGPEASRYLSSLSKFPAEGKQGKLQKKNPCQGKYREFGNFAKTQGILYAFKVLNSLISKDEGYCDVCREIS